MLKKAHAVHRDLVAEAVPLDPVAEFVKKTIAANKVVIFSKTTCPYSDMAKEVSRNTRKDIYTFSSKEYIKTFETFFTNIYCVVFEL